MKNNKTPEFLLASAVLAIVLGGCEAVPPKKLPITYDSVHSPVAQESKVMLEHQERLRQEIERKNAEVPPIEPVLPQYNPLDDMRVSLTLDNADINHVLQALVRDVNMNLLIHPDVAASQKRVSLRFDNVPASAVLKELLRIADVYGTVEGNVLRVEPYEERIFRLDFLETNPRASFEAGGNVLGSNILGGIGAAGGSGGTSGLTGQFTVSGQSAESSNPYDQLRDMVEGLLGNQGAFSLNRMAGTLYVKARPSLVQSVARIIDRYKDVLSRQILIEGQILEVRLNDQYRYGIDWSYVRNRVAVTRGPQALVEGLSTILPVPDGARPQNPRTIVIPSQGADTFGRRLGLNYAGGNFAATLELLDDFGDVRVLSNPTLRVKHAQPALITVGSTNAYIRETEVTNTISAAGGILTETEVTVDSVFDGLVVGVIPFVTDDGRVNMVVHPIRSDVDPASLTLIDLGGTAAVALPRVDLKELTTTIDARDGDVVILGGLIDKTKSNNRQGVPGVSDVPGFGWLTTSLDNTDTVRELVIVFKVTVL